MLQVTRQTMHCVFFARSQTAQYSLATHTSKGAENRTWVTDHWYVCPQGLSQSMPIPSNRAPLTDCAIFATQNLVSFSKNSSPLRPKQKFATPPGTRILPISVPPAFQTLTPSPHPEYTLPTVSHLMPSGISVSAMANNRRLARKSAPERRITSNA